MGKSSTWGSTAFSSEVKGAGSVAGAGETPSVGPGPAAKKVEMSGNENPKGAAYGGKPRGMKTYSEG